MQETKFIKIFILAFVVQFGLPAMGSGMEDGNRLTIDGLARRVAEVFANVPLLADPGEEDSENYEEMEEVEEEGVGSPDEGFVDVDASAPKFFRTWKIKENVANWVQLNFLPPQERLEKPIVFGSTRRGRTVLLAKGTPVAGCVKSGKNGRKIIVPHGTWVYFYRDGMHLVGKTFYDGGKVFYITGKVEYGNPEIIYGEPKNNPTGAIKSLCEKLGKSFSRSLNGKVCFALHSEESQSYFRSQFPELLPAED